MKREFILLFVLYLYIIVYLSILTIISNIIVVHLDAFKYRYLKKVFRRGKLTIVFTDVLQLTGTGNNGWSVPMGSPEISQSILALIRIARTDEGHSWLYHSSRKKRG